MGCRISTPGTGKRFFSSRKRLYKMSGPHVALYSVGIGSKSSGFGAGPSHPSRAEVKNERSYTSIHTPILRANG